MTPASTKQPVDYAIVCIKEGVNLDEIVAQQTTTPITYPEITAIANEEPWEQPLAELLQAID